MTPHTEKDVLVLQGGGALGAYQAGAYEAPVARIHSAARAASHRPGASAWLRFCTLLAS
jgi:hypothetical protein